MQDDFTKRCSKCGRIRPRTDFHKDSRLPGGLHSHCWECRSEHMRRCNQAKAKPRARAERRTRQWSVEDVARLTHGARLKPAVMNQGYWSVFPKGKQQSVIFPGVYVVGHDDGLIKVGIAANMHARLRGINRIHPLQHVYALYWIEDEASRRAVEAGIHDALHDVLASGWGDRFMDEARVLDILTQRFGYDLCLFA